MVLGAVAVGGITVVALRKKDYDEEMTCKYQEFAVLISEKGIEVNGIADRGVAKFAAYAVAPELKGKKDVFLHPSKATDMELASIGEGIPYLKENRFLHSVRKGICEDKLMEPAGKRQISVANFNDRVFRKFDRNILVVK